MFAKFFVDRPVLASVLSILIVLAGLVAILKLPIEQYPSIVPPTIQITARYPGADAQTVARAVAAPIEQQLAGAKGLLYYRSQCANDGSMTLVATFEVGTDQDIAAVEVQNRLSIAQPRLPQEVVRNGMTVEKASSSMLAVIAIQSDNKQYDDLYLSNYATINLLDPLKRVKGIGSATVFGGKDYAMRIWVNPDRMMSKSLSISDLAQSIREQNAVYPAGAIGQSPGAEGVVAMPAITRGRLSDPQDYRQIILRANSDGSTLRLGDVARVELGSEIYSLYGRYNGRPTAFVLVNLQVGANALEAMNGVNATLKELAASFPPGITWISPYDTTPYIDLSIREVAKTLMEAIGLVLLVVFVFLQSWRATLIPLLAVPVAIIGTFAGMIVLGFSINTLTLFGLVLAIGIVVDDAIIVVENVERIMHEFHLPPREATIKAMEQVTGPLIAIVLVLGAVFVPVAFIGGLTGQLYRQFAITIAVSVAISGLVALTLSPALCALLLKADHGKKALLFRAFDAVFNRFTNAYVWGVMRGIQWSLASLAIFGILTWTGWRLANQVPSGLIPEEDQGYLIAVVLLPDGASLQRTDALVRKVEEFYLGQSAVKDVVTLGGFDLLTGGTASTSSATLFIGLKPFALRHGPGQSVQEIIGATWGRFANETSGMVISFNMPAIPGLGQRAGFEMELQDRGGSSISALAQESQKFLAQAQKNGRLVDLNATLRVTQPQLYVDLDREQTKTRGVAVGEVFDTLQASLSSLYINDFDQFGRIWRVQMQAEPQFRRQPGDIGRFFVRNARGQMVPLSDLLKTRFQAGPNAVTRFNGFPSVQITGAPAAGLSSGDALTEVRQIASTALSSGYGVEFTGASYQEQRAGNQAPKVLAFGILVVFLVLAAQYESWSLPVAVLLSIPIAVLGAYLAIHLRGLAQDVYFQVGLLTLVGLAAKNAILIVEFGVSEYRRGRPAKEAALEAARLRFRPIVMTSLAFVMGVFPLVYSSGAGAAARHSIGTGVIGGMLASTFLAVFFVPLFFVLVSRRKS